MKNENVSIVAINKVAKLCDNPFMFGKYYAALQNTVSGMRKAAMRNDGAEVAECLNSALFHIEKIPVALMVDYKRQKEMRKKK